jgi:dTMP kinase
MREHKGTFVTFEKTKEGLGGTTQSLLLYERLSNLGYDVVYTREPGGTELGEKLRSILLDPKTELSKATELFLLMAIRAQHYKEVLKPALKDGKIVICDRFIDSTLTYQGSGQKWKIAFLWRLHHASTGSLIPNITFVLHGKPYRQRNSEDRIEAYDDSFHRRVEKGMLHIATKSERYKLINANKPIEELSEQIFGEVLSHINK